MLNLRVLHAYLTQLVSDNVHTALLLTAEGAVVSFASPPTPSSPAHRSKDDISILAGLSAEVWAETTEEAKVESELGRILVVPVDDAGPEAPDDREPLLLLALHGSAEAEWDIMRTKANTLAAYLAPSLNKHRGAIERVPPPRAPAPASKTRTRSTTTSPGGFLR